MINIFTTLYLLAFPIGLMGLVQAFFSILSWFVFHDHETADFLLPASLMLTVAGLFLILGKRYDVSKVSFRDALIFAVLTWVLSGFLGAIPIILITGVSLTDGVFESISALTTTGATILSGLDQMPRTFLLFRQFLQWLGGLGVVIFVVAVLPILNVGGMKLLRAETPGPFKDDKLSPRIANTAHFMWYVYITITLLCAVAYFLGGMSVYDAIAHSFTTVSTGGFSTHDASMGYFDSPGLLIISDVFMLVGAVSFALHFRVWHAGRLHLYWRDEETRWFLAFVILLAVLIGVFLLRAGVYNDSFTAFNLAFFHLISFITSTGFGAAGFSDWPYAVTFLLLVAGYLGGCAGSTAGGNKFIRNILCVKLMNLELRRLISPRGIFLVKYQGRSVEEKVLSATISFMSIAAFLSMTFTLMLMATGLDFWSSLSAVAACLNVLGPGFGELANNFQPVTDTGTWILSIAMILGRLEYLTVLALFSPLIWRY